MRSSETMTYFDRCVLIKKNPIRLKQYKLQKTKNKKTIKEMY